MRKKKVVESIFVLDNENDIVDNIDKINLEKDIIFSLPENAKENVYIDFSGSIKVTLGENFNLSVVQNKFDSSSPFRIWKVNSRLKFCFPRGVVPIFSKPNNNRSCIGTNVLFEQFLSVKLIKSDLLKKTIESNGSIIYQNLVVETTTNKVILGEDIPTLIIPMDTVLFEILPVKTYLSENSYCGKLYLIKNNEFYYHFKESV